MATVDILHVVGHTLPFGHLDWALVVSTAGCRPVEVVSNGRNPAVDLKGIPLIRCTLQFLAKTYGIQNHIES
jgi:hypothetical protein